MNICMELASPLLLEPYVNKFLSCAYVLSVDFEGGFTSVYIRHIPSSKISIFSPDPYGAIHGPPLRRTKPQILILPSGFGLDTILCNVLQPTPGVLQPASSQSWL